MNDNLLKLPSRAGLKLLYFLQRYQSNSLPIGAELIKLIPYPINIQSAICLDLGAAHGGFTACLLNAGAQKVYAVDVAYGQFAWELRNHPKVVLLERTNARYLSTQLVPEPINIVTSDLSFISTIKIVPAVLPLLEPKAIWLMLCKPQFEIKKELLDNLSKDQFKKGVILDSSIVKQVLLDCCLSLSELGLSSLPVDLSLISGREGNKEYWVLLWIGSPIDTNLLIQAINILVP